jgi:2-keto-4-pentenoate hydratase/2-oxohepta-3-ene-1,7-dioic acid hydratase in catechol pathway
VGIVQDLRRQRPDLRDPPLAAGPAPPQGRITLSVNGAVRQDANVGDMIWNVAEIIAEASKLWTLAAAT